MKIHRPCREVTRLVLEGQDRTLLLHERISVRLHMWICKACPTFERQAGQLRTSMQRWRAYAESDDPGR